MALSQYSSTISAGNPNDDTSTVAVFPNTHMNVMLNSGLVVMGFGKDRYGLCFNRRRPPVVGLGRVPLCEPLSRPDCIDLFPRNQVRRTNDWQALRHAALIHHAVGNKAHERPMNLQ